MAEPRRAYVTATFRRRLHQVAFRERVIDLPDRTRLERRYEQFRQLAANA